MRGTFKEGFAISEKNSCEIIHFVNFPEHFLAIGLGIEFIELTLTLLGVRHFFQVKILLFIAAFVAV